MSMIDFAADRNVERALPGTGSWVARVDIARGRLDVVEANPSGPAVASDGDVTLLFDGVLYNGAELAREFEAHEAWTDASVLLAGYRRLGAEVVQCIRGIFALVIVDGQDRSAVVVRDALGIYSVFYARAGNGLVVSPFIEPLVRQPDVSRELNVEALADHFCDQWPIPEETYYRHVSRVVAGHALFLTPATCDQRLWWRPPLPTTLDEFRDDDVDRFEYLLKQAVQRSLDLGPAAISLSGGIDSGTVAAVAARLLQENGAQPLLAAAVQFDPDADSRESRIQRGVAHHLELPLIMRSFDDVPGYPDYLQYAIENVADSQCPDVSTWNAAYVQQAADVQAAGRTVIMTGNGGDEWMGVSAAFSGDLMRKGEWRSLIRLVRSTRYTFHAPMHSLLRAMLWKWGINAIVRTALRDAALRTVPQLVHARWERSALQTMPGWVAPGWGLRRRLLDRRAGTWSSGGRLNPLDTMRASLNSPLVSMEAEEAFELSRRTGVSYAHPLLDVDLVEYLSSASLALLTIDNKTKGLARRILERELPGFGFEHQHKYSVTSFGGIYIHRQLGRVWDAHGSVSALSELGVVDGKAVSRLVESVLNSAHGDGQTYRIWTLLALEAWVRKRL